jgi:ATP-dependent helicase HrpA
MHKTFEDRNSDFISLLNIWNRYHDALQTEKTTAGLRRFCKRNFLSYMRMREWRDIHYQIRSLLEESGTSTNSKKNRSCIENEDEDTVRYRAIHRSVLSGFLSNIAEKKEQNLYKAAQGRDVMIFPGSGIFNRSKQWVVAVEMVETSRLFARCVGNIDASWILDLGRDQCKYSYQHPRWAKNRGEVVASEQVSLYGLIIVPQRTVSYGLINPGEATDIFIRDALVADDLDESFDFLKHNTARIDEIRDLENRIRRRDLLVGEKKLRRFYKERLSHVYDVSTLRKRIKEKGADDFLRMDKKFLLKYDPDEEEMALFPDRILLGTNQFNCQYRYEPGKSEDGLTIRLPVTVASAIPPDSVDWLVPGLLREKITAMIKGLPKAYRKKLVPISKVVDIVLKEMPKTEAPLVSSLSQFIFKRLGIDIPASEWSMEDLPDHLKMRLCLTDTKGKEIRSGRDKVLLTRELSRPDDEEEFYTAKQQWEKHNIKRWDFGDLPETIYTKGKTGIRWVYYPALTKSDGSVNLRLFRHRDKAFSAHKQGVAALYAVTLSKEFKLLRKMMTLPQGMKQAVSHFGGEHHVENRIFQSVVSDLFFKNIRTEKAFLRHAESVKPSMFQIGKEKQECTVAVLRQYHQTRMLLIELESANQTNRRATAFLKHLFSDLSKLLPVNFLELYHTDRLKYLVRYLKTMAIRAQRGIVDFERDQARAKELKIYTDSLDGLLKGLDPTVSEEKRKEIEDLFWLIEEYKVSLFAQELKTAVPVSKKRLDAKIKAIRRKV